MAFNLADAEHGRGPVLLVVYPLQDSYAWQVKQM